MIELTQDSYGRNVFYTINSDGSCLYTVYVDSGNTQVAFTVHLLVRNDTKAMNTINSMAPSGD